jgi:hypothetical protein
MTSSKLPHVSAPECHLQGIFQNNGTQDQHANLGTDRPHWYHYYIQILGYIKSKRIHLECCAINTMWHWVSSSTKWSRCTDIAATGVITRDPAL